MLVFQKSTTNETSSTFFGRLEASGIYNYIYIYSEVHTNARVHIISRVSYILQHWIHHNSDSTPVVPVTKTLNLRWKVCSGSTIRTLLNGKINPKDWQVLSLGDIEFFFFRVVSGDYGKRCMFHPILFPCSVRVPLVHLAGAAFDAHTKYHDWHSDWCSA